METVPSSGVSSFLFYFVVFCLACFFFYVYFAVTLMLLARKTRTEGAGLAWLPIGNMFLLCRVAQRPSWWVLLMFLPVINLVVLAMAWASVADVRGKPALLGALAILPGIGLLVPLILLIGKQPMGPAPFDATIAARFCQRCRQPIVGNDVFCRACGSPAPTAVAAGWQTQALHGRTSTGVLTLMGSGSALVTLAIYGVAAWYFLFSAITYTAPNRTQPVISERTGGTLVEFPVDSRPDGPSVGSVIVEELNRDTGSGTGTTGTGSTSSSSTSRSSTKTPSDRLPPGVTIDILRGKGTVAATTAVYKPKNKGNPKDQVYVCVLRGPGGSTFPGEISSLVQTESNGSQNGIQLTSPKGASYSGTKTETGSSIVYVLEKLGTDLVVLVYAPTAAVHEEAARLVANVGNGEGLNDYPDVKNSYWVLPQTPPEGLSLIDFSTQDRESIMAGTTTGNRSSDRESSEYLRDFVPNRALIARYASSTGRDWEAAVFDYGETRQARNIWLLVRWTIGLTSMQPINVRGDEALWIDSGTNRILFYQKGPYLILITAPSNASPQNLADMAGRFQV